MPGSASYSAHTPTANGPLPKSARKAVSNPPAAAVISKPRSATNACVLAQLRCSANASSGSAWIAWDSSIRSVPRRRTASSTRSNTGVEAILAVSHRRSPVITTTSCDRPPCPRKRGFVATGSHVARRPDVRLGAKPCLRRDKSLVIPAGGSHSYSSPPVFHDGDVNGPADETTQIRVAFPDGQRPAAPLNLLAPQPKPDRSAHNRPAFRQLHAQCGDLLPILLGIGIKVGTPHPDRGPAPVGRAGQPVRAEDAAPGRDWRLTSPVRPT